MSSSQFPGILEEELQKRNLEEEGGTNVIDGCIAIWRESRFFCCNSFCVGQFESSSVNGL